MKSLYLLILLFLTTSSLSFSQVIVPKIDWKKGESKKITMKLNGKEIKNGTTSKDTTFTTKSELFVQEITDSSYIVKFTTENQLVKAGSVYYKGLEKELSDNRNLDVDVIVNKKSMVSEMINKEEHDFNLSKIHSEIIEILKAKAPEKVNQATIQLDEILKSFTDKSEALHTLDFILESYRVNYSFSDTLITLDSIANPFKLQNFNGAKVKTYTKKYTDTYDVFIEMSYDFDAYKKLLSAASNNVVGIVGSMLDDNDSQNTMVEMSKVLNMLYASNEFEASDSFIITRKNDLNWPLKINKEVDLKLTNNNVESAGLIKILIEIK